MIRTSKLRSQAMANFTVVILLLLAAYATSPAGYAQTQRDWTNFGGDNDWFNSNNWNPAGGPASDDWLVIDGGNPTTAVLVDVERGGIVDISRGSNVTTGRLTIGRVGEGTLAMWDNSTLSTSSGTGTGAGVIGAEINAVGRANLSNAVAWDLDGTLTVGDAGQGTLNMSDAAEVNTTEDTVVGEASSGIGLVNVSGVGSSFSTANLAIGSSGSGTFNLTNGALVDAEIATLGDLSGSTGKVSIGGGGTWTSSAMRIGRQGLGSMEISGGGQMITSSPSSNASLGSADAGVGHALVDGPNSLWDIAAGLTVGNQGRGELEVRDGGRVQSDLAPSFIASFPGSIGHAVIHGNGSMWSNSNLTVGQAGDASLLVAHGADVDSTSGLIAQTTGSSGVVTIDGYDSGWSNSGTLEVGRAGVAELRITTGATVSNTAADIGNSSGSLGRVNVFGAGSRWTNDGNLLVGRSGVGHLQVRDGALVTSAGGVVSLSGTSTGSTATIDGAGSRWTMSNNLQVGSGNGSDGTLVVTGGGRFNTAAGITIANGTGSAGHVTANGAGSTISTVGDLLVGNAGTGDMTIDSGAAATVGGETSIGPSGTLLIDDATLTTGSLSQTSGGTFGFASGTVTIDGGTFQTAGSIYTLDSPTLATMNFINGAINNDEELTVGSVGSAVANFSGGSTFNNGAFAMIGGSTGSHGTMNLMGAGTELVTTDELIVGNAGVGILNIADGAAAASEGVSIGSLASGNGTVRLESGASLTASFLALAQSGSGIFSIADGASASVSGDLEIGAGAQLTLLGGTLHVNNLTSTSGGMLSFESGVLDIDGMATVHDGASAPLSGLSIPALGVVHVSGSIVGPVVSQHGSRIEVDGPAAALGHSSSLIGVDLNGQLHVGGNTLTLNSTTYSQLGSLTTFRGGTIVAPNGVSLDSGDVLSATGFVGTVDGKVAAGVGSLMRGAFTLGDATAADGFTSDGVLEVATVLVGTTTLLDANQAVLGSLTRLGEVSLISFPSTLSAPNGVIVDFGRNIEGYGTVDTPNDPLRPTIINGHAEGADSDHQLTFSGYVKGVGTFADVVFNGTFAPGLSPATVETGNLAFGSESVLEMELGGYAPGSQHDQLVVDGAAQLDGTLLVSLLDGFQPQAGDQFEILKYESFRGAFDGVAFAGPLNGTLDYGARSLVLTVAAVPEPGAAALAAMALLAAVGRVRRRR